VPWQRPGVLVAVDQVGSCPCSGRSWINVGAAMWAGAVGADRWW
jgi:hypothetical protein